MRRARHTNTGPVVAAVALLLLLISGRAFAVEGEGGAEEGLVAKIDRLYTELRVDEANTTCLEAFEAGGHDLATHADLLYSCAVVSATLGDRDRAQQLCRASLSLRPDRLPAGDATPRLVEAFNEAAAWWSERAPMSVAHTPPAASHSGEAVVMKVTAESDPAELVRGAMVTYRRPDGAWVSTPTALRAGRDVLIPVAVAGSLTYYVTATDSHGSVVWQLGSADAPLVTSPAVGRPGKPRGPKTRKPFYKHWWFWAASGGGLGVVIIATTVGAFAARPSSATLVFEVSDR